jgi:hypothetical protein
MQIDYDLLAKRTETASLYAIPDEMKERWVAKSHQAERDLWMAGALWVLEEIKKAEAEGAEKFPLPMV